MKHSFYMTRVFISLFGFLDIASFISRLSPFHLKVIINSYVNLFQEERENVYGNYFLSFTQIWIYLIQVCIIELIALARRLRFHWLDYGWVLSPTSWYSRAAAAAKSLQLCRTLWDHIDGSPPGSPIPGMSFQQKVDFLIGGEFGGE